MLTEFKIRGWIEFKIRGWHWRAARWWKEHALLRYRLKAFRMFVAGEGKKAREYARNMYMVVATGQIQSRTELKAMTWQQVMAAYRDGRLDYLMQKNTHYTPGYTDRQYERWRDDPKRTYRYYRDLRRKREA